MKTLFITAFTLLASTTFAQQLVTWKGGTPGREDQWAVAQNWSNNRVPDEFADVFIPDVSTSTFVYPVICNGEFEVNSLQMAATAALTILEDAVLTVSNDSSHLILGDLKLE
ncbi:MAG: hypothetical protein KDC44_23130, partial [Phaeodactylibacter sp.]|nr:hypothetical protein [Phaeodactylibacter sp.]